MKTKEAQLWFDIQDIIGPAKLWPHKIRRYFWTPNLKHFERICICAFVYINGLNPIVFFEWVLLKNLNGNSTRLGEFKDLLNAFETNPSKYSYWGYNISMNQYQFLDGKPKPYIHASIRNK